ncbi:hypothetical protein [Streptomyces zagrosensis]|uniref:Uncharacterized protein n=1 Tax=Streptomyces zagrosensis TaxID=1042984 RepID=A0A7W9UWS1_9ACTN|nr:hypothetical protein [Streptomyces zagrosensis]MBB5933842.1 hypothetical protein [Streptomyces zagrosensis]
MQSRSVPTPAEARNISSGVMSAIMNFYSFPHHLLRVEATGAAAFETRVTVFADRTELATESE